jgi:hypothetical protein
MEAGWTPREWSSKTAAAKEAKTRPPFSADGMCTMQACMTDLPQLSNQQQRSVTHVGMMEALLFQPSKRQLLSRTVS